MNKLSRRALAAVAILAAVPAGVGIAKTIENARWNALSPETRARLDEGRIAMAKAALKLSPDQEKLWAPLEAQARDAMKSMADKRAERQKMRDQFEKDRAEGKRPDMAERLDKMSQSLSERADRMKSLAAAFRPFYASLSDEQKDVLRPLMRQMGRGFGLHERHGQRHAWFGGWGPGGPERGGHEGHRDHGHWGGGRHGGYDRNEPPASQDGGGAGGGDRPAGTPQRAPDFGDDGPAAWDSL